MVPGGVPTRFSWSVPSPRKRKAPPERHPLPQKKLFATTSASSDHTELHVVSETDITAESLSKSTATASNRNTEPNDTCSELNAPKKIEELEEEVLKLRQENTELKKKLDEVEKQNEAISARLFSQPSDGKLKGC